jgi:hypothetical protein
VLAVFLVPGPAGPCLPQLFFTTLVQFISLSASPNAAAWFSNFDSVLAWVPLLLLKGIPTATNLVLRVDRFSIAMRSLPC